MAQNFRLHPEQIIGYLIFFLKNMFWTIFTFFLWKIFFNFKLLELKLTKNEKYNVIWQV